MEEENGKSGKGKEKGIAIAPEKGKSGKGKEKGKEQDQAQSSMGTEAEQEVVVAGDPY